MLAGLLPLAGDLVKRWLTNKQERQAAKQKTELAIENRKTEMAAQRGEHDDDWELERLKQPPDRPMRRVLASTILLPLPVTVFFPDHAGLMWERLATVPGPYWWLVGTILGFYFASKGLPGILGRLKQAIAKRKATA